MRVLDGPVQIAYAVADVRVAASEWVQRGAGPFFVREHIDVHHVRVRGRAATFDHSSAYGQWGSVMVELIHQHGGDDPVVGSSGVHHVAFFVDTFADAATELIDAGRAEVLYAETASGMPFAFHDARSDLGHLIEIYERSSPLVGFYDMVREASIDWNGDNPVRIL